MWTAPLFILTALAAIVLYVRLLQGPVSLRIMAAPIERGITAAVNGPTGNPMKNIVRLEVEPRLSNGARFGANASAKAWYLFAEPAACSTIVAFLNGRDTPTVEYFGLSTEPNRLAASWRVYFDWGVATCDFRAAVKAKGEA